jgi:hypothetical protein
MGENREGRDDESCNTQVIFEPRLESARIKLEYVTPNKWRDPLIVTSTYAFFASGRRHRYGASLIPTSPA